MADGNGGAAMQERFLRLAFTAADLLLELGADGAIAYASGAFNSHFGEPAEHFLGEDVRRLIAPSDRAAVAASLAEAEAAGRSMPSLVHLANPARTGLLFAALASQGGTGGFAVTLSRAPRAPHAAGEAIQDARTFTREAEMLLKNGAQPLLSLLDVGECNPADEARQKEIATALARAPELGDEPLVGRLASGRFGILSREASDLATLCERIGAMLGSGGARGVQGTGFPLTAGELGTARTVRALRSALLSFAKQGVAGLNEAGFARGLEGFLAAAGSRVGAIRRTIAGRQFRLAFQPVVGLADRKVRHYETLLRPSSGAGIQAASTQEFVAFAEAAGLSEELDVAVLEEALGALRDAPDAVLAVNLSGLSLQDPAFREQLLALLARSGVWRKRLLVELTETAEIDDIAAASGTLAALREAGVPVCLDDFGAGQAAFRYLRDFRVDVIKLDGAYLRAALNGARERAMLASMAALARDVEAEVVVEMIETAEQEALCRAIGADLGQGWFYGKPGRLPGSLTI